MFYNYLLKVCYIEPQHVLFFFIVIKKSSIIIIQITVLAIKPRNLDLSMIEMYDKF